MITGHSGSVETVDQLLEMVEYPACQEALQNLKNVLAVLDDYNLMQYISIDLGMLQSINYYTGIIFKGFTYGLGFPLFSGGRYDNVVSSFGRDLAATGFSIGINFVMAALRRQGQPDQNNDSLIRLVYDEGQRPRALAISRAWRENGLQVICESIRDANLDYSILEDSVQLQPENLHDGVSFIPPGKNVIIRLEQQGNFRLYRGKEKQK
jgi:ATP phosphoribosyltransferase regulatory subunit